MEEFIRADSLGKREEIRRNGEQVAAGSTRKLEPLDPAIASSRTSLLSESFVHRAAVTN